MNSNQAKILLVDDEPDIIEILNYNLSKVGYSVFSAKNGKEAIQLSKSILPDIIILDVMMPELDGIQVCEQIRQIEGLNNTIIAFLTARSEDYSEIAGLQAGADDYITKPIRPKVLIARIEALLKRRNVKKSPEISKLIVFDDISVDVEKHLVYYNSKELTLPKKEFNLLQLLISNPNRVYTRDEIYSKVWGDEIIVGDRTIDVHIRKLREKFDEKYIDTIKGIGYTFNKRN